MIKEYVEVVLEGSFDFIKGFVLGFLEGKGIDGEAIFEEAGRARGDVFVRLMRFIRLEEDRVHLIVGAGIHELLKAALERRQDEVPVRIVTVRKILGAHFEFHYRTYSQPLGTELKNIFLNLPEGIQVEGYEPKETLRPESKAIEAYAPEHPYAVEAEGKISGQAMEVIDLFNHLGNYEIVELGDIEMEKDPICS
jgi:hypothetical protein